MSLTTALQSDGNSRIAFYFQRRNKKGEWETIGTIYSPVNDWKQGAIKRARDMCEDSMLGKYNRARRKGDDQARIMTVRALVDEENELKAKTL